MPFVRPIMLQIPTRRPLRCRPCRHYASDREGERSADGQLAVDRRLDLAAADRAAHGLDVALERQRVSGTHDALEAHVVDAGEESQLAAILLLREHRDRTALGERLDHLHPGHDRVAGEVSRTVQLGDRLAGHDTLTGDELDHLVDQEHRIAVREHRLDRRLVENHAGHAESLRASVFRPRWA